MTLSWATGGIGGSAHARRGQDGQDGVAVVAAAERIVVVVTDGCSSGARSELGARLGARWLAVLAARGFDPARPAASSRSVTEALVRRLAVLARSLSTQGRIEPGVVDEALLFGFLVAVVTTETAAVFGVGDGIVSVDGVTTVLDPGPENAPRYVGYALVGGDATPEVHVAGPAEVVTIATDGVAPLAARLPELAADPRLFANRSLLTKRLRVLGRQIPLDDDATLAIVRRSA